MSTIDTSKMTLSQIMDYMAKNTGDINLLNQQIKDLNKQNWNLQEAKNIRLSEFFSDYIELGTNYKVTSYMNLIGVQTGIKKGDITYPSSFSPDDVIEFTKKNKKSIVITCLSKSMYKFENKIRVGPYITKPNWTFRVDTDSLYHYLMRDSQFKQGFDSYLKRCEALELLGI